MADFEQTELDGVIVFTPRRHRDSRGYFAETWKRSLFAEHGIDIDFVQDNQSQSLQAGTLRGLHFQSAPYGQDKLIRVLRGRIFDVVVDLRRSSPTFGRHVAAELSAENGRQLLVPVGFAHGFLTLEAETEVAYKVSAEYSPAHEHGLAFDDPALGIDWPWPAGKPVMSDKDAHYPLLADLPVYFR